MKGHHCRVPNVLDKQFAKNNRVPGYDLVIANLRGLYEDMHNGEKLTSLKDYEKLKAFKNELIKSKNKELADILNCNKKDAVASATRLLKTEFTNREIDQLSGYISRRLTDAISYLIDKDPTVVAWKEAEKNKGNIVTREECIKHLGTSECRTKLLATTMALIRSDYTTKREGDSLYNNPTLQKLFNSKVDALNVFLWIASDDFSKREGFRIGKKLRTVVEFTEDDKLDFNVTVSEDSVKDGWMREKDKETLFSKSSSIVRKFLGRQLVYERKLKAVTKTINGKDVTVYKPVIVTDGGFPRCQNPVKFHAQIAKILTGCTSEENMMERLKRAGGATIKDVKDANIYRLIDFLEKDPQLEAAFYKDFKSTSVVFTAIKNKMGKAVCSVINSFTRKHSYYKYTHSLLATNEHSGSIYTVRDGVVVVSGDAVEDLKNYIKENTSGKDSFSSNVALTHDEELQAKAEYESSNKTVTFKEFLNQKLNSKAFTFVNEINKRLELGLTDELIRDLVNNAVCFKDFISNAIALAGDTHTKDGCTVDKLSGIFKDRIAKMYKNVDDADTASPDRIRIGQGKSASSYSTRIEGCKFSTVVDKITDFAKEAQYFNTRTGKEREDGLQKVVNNIQTWLNDNFGKSSEYFDRVHGETIVNGETRKGHYYSSLLQKLYETNVDTLTDPTAFVYQFMYTRTMISDGVLAEDFSEMTDLNSDIANYFFINNKVDGGYGMFPLFTTGDSLALKYIKLEKHGYKGLMRRFAQVARSEIARMQLEKRVADKLANDEKLNQETAHISDITPLANKSEEEITGNFIYLKCLNKYKDVLREKLKEDKENDTSIFDDAVIEILKKELFDEYVNDFYNKVKGSDMFANDPNLGDKAFKAFSNISNFNNATALINPADDSSVTNGMFMYYLNTKYAYIEQYQLLGANPAQYGLSTIMQKRYKAYNAPGEAIDVDIKDYDGNYYIEHDKNGAVKEKCIYFEDNEISAERLDRNFYDFIKAKLPNVASIYDKNDATDGQGFRILSSYRKVMGASLQWTPKLETLYKQIQQFRHDNWNRIAKKKFGTEYDNLSKVDKATVMNESFFTEEQLDFINSSDVAFQPIKPHTCTVEQVKTEGGDVLLIPVEHKYAEALIIPELFAKDSFRRKLAIRMELEGHDLACSNKCVKVGCFGSADFRTSTAETFDAAYDGAYVHNIEYSDYTIQTHKPEHINVMQLFGTQLRKHMFDAINLDGAYTFIPGVDKFTLNGETLSLHNATMGGRNFLKFYNSLICANMTTSLSDLAETVGNITDLSDVLTQLAVNDDMTTTDDVCKFSLNKDNDGFENPICEPSRAQNIEGSLTSLFKKNVNKQKINGGSCVQVSDFGIVGFEDGGSDLKVHLTKDGQNIEYVDVAMAWDLSWTDSKGMKHTIPYTKYCNTDGTLKMEGNKALLDIDFPGIRDIVLYRIPTEREYSIINGKVSRFFPKIAGGMVMVPAQFTTVAGFDFDIDTLQYFRKEFRQAEDLSKEQISKAWAKIYGLNRDDDGNIISGNHIYNALKDAKEKAIREYDKQNNTEDGETVAQSSNYSNPTMESLAPELFAKLKEQTGSGEETAFVDPLSEIQEDPRNLKLYTFWEEAGLTEKEGMTAEAYFSKHVAENQTDYLTWEEYDYSKNAEDNTVTARNNELIKCIQSRLTDPATIEARYTPGGFTNAKHDANVLKVAMYKQFLKPESIRKVFEKAGISKVAINSISDAEDFVTYCEKFSKDKEEGKEFKRILDELDPERDVTNVLTTATYNARNRVASKVIGIMANHNTNAVYSKVLKTLALREPITMFGHSFDNLNGNEHAEVNYMLTLAELLASSVDAVKVPVLNFLNINSSTASIAALMGRLGFTTEEVGLFLNQPIILELCDYMANNNEHSISRAIKEVLSKHGFNVSDLKTKIVDFNKETLFQNIGKEVSSKLNDVQADVMAALNIISEKAQALSDFIDKTKFTAANSIENSLGSLIELVYENRDENNAETSLHRNIVMSFGNFDTQTGNEAAAELSSPIINPRTEKGKLIDLTLDYLQSDEYRKFLATTPFAFEQMMHDAIVAYLNSVCKYFPYRTNLYKNAYDSIFMNLLWGNLDKDTIDDINIQLPVFLLSRKENSQFNPDEFVETKDEEGNTIQVTNKEFYTVYFPKMLREILQERSTLLGVNSTDGYKEQYERLQEKYPILKNVDREAFFDNMLLDNLTVDEYVKDERKADINTNVDALLSGEIQQTNTSSFSIGIEGNVHFDKDIKSKLSGAWSDLVGKNTKNIRNSQTSLAHALFMYNFYMRGYQPGANSFNNIAPVEVTSTLMIDNRTNAIVSYNSFFDTIVNSEYYPATLNNAINTFIMMFYANNSNNTKLVKTFYANNKGIDITKHQSEGSASRGIPSYETRFSTTGEEIITFDLSRSKSASAILMQKSKRKLRRDQVAVIPCFRVVDKDREGNVTTKLFVLDNLKTGSRFNFTDPNYVITSDNSKISYVEIPIKGNDSGTMVDYSMDNVNQTASEDTDPFNEENVSDEATKNDDVHYEDSEMIMYEEDEFYDPDIAGQAEVVKEKAVKNCKDDNICVLPIK